MAKSAQRSGVRPGASVGKAMRLLLPPRVDQILSLEEPVRATDVDGVHDIRVATKRLREAVRLFRPAFGKVRLAAHVQHLEQLNDALGKARELDVLELHLVALGQRDAGLNRSLQRLIARTREEGEAAAAQLAPVLDETLPFLKEDFDSLLRDRSRKRRRVWRMPFVQLACVSVAQRVETAFAIEAAAREPSSVAEFHRMRIAVKKVKYAVELFLDVLGRPVRKAYGPITDLQELMGQVHDCDVLLGVLAATSGVDVTVRAGEKAMRLVAADRADLHTRTVALLDEIRRRKLIRPMLKACGKAS